MSETRKACGDPFLEAARRARSITFNALAALPEQAIHRRSPTGSFMSSPADRLYVNPRRSIPLDERSSDRMGRTTVVQVNARQRQSRSRS
jgi:hypothetical protein